MSAAASPPQTKPHIEFFSKGAPHEKIAYHHPSCRCSFAFRMQDRVRDNEGNDSGATFGNWYKSVIDTSSDVVSATPEMFFEVKNYGF